MAKSPPANALLVKEARGTTERKPRAERLEELLDAAASVFYEKGYDAATLQDIASRVGILKGSIYYYIESKADLRDHLVVEVHRQSLEMVKRLAQTDGSALQKLAAIIHGHVDYIARNLAKVTVYQQQLTALDPAQRKKLFGGDHHGYRDVLQGVMDRGQDEGTLLNTLDTKLASQTMLSSLNSLHQWYRPSRQRPANTIAEYLTLTLLRGHASDKGIQLLATLGLPDVRAPVEPRLRPKK